MCPPDVVGELLSKLIKHGRMTIACQYLICQGEQSYDIQSQVRDRQILWCVEASFYLSFILPLLEISVSHFKIPRSYFLFFKDVDVAVWMYKINYRSSFCLIYLISAFYFHPMCMCLCLQHARDSGAWMWTAMCGSTCALRLYTVCSAVIHQHHAGGLFSFLPLCCR